jgi:hypothetical protein
MRTTAHGLTVWNNTSDNFDHTQLAANWDLIDSYWTGFDTTTQLPNRIATVTTLPVSPTAGQLVMPIVNIGSLPAYCMARYDGSQWLPVGIASIQGTLPSSPVAGQIVILSAATSNFSAWSTVRFDGTNWDHVGAFGYVNTGSGALNIKGAQITGDVYVNTSARGLVLVDRITGLKYRLYINNTALTLESVS